jgi:hypothetical protein
MVLRYNEKGKFFTEFISKVEIPVTIQTETNRIHGYVYVRKGERLSDELNSSRSFIPISDATIYNAQGDTLYTCGFLTVHRDHIVWLMPEGEEPRNDPEQSGGES